MNIFDAGLITANEYFYIEVKGNWVICFGWMDGSILVLDMNGA